MKKEFDEYLLSQFQELISKREIHLGVVESERKKVLDYYNDLFN